MRNLNCEIYTQTIIWSFSVLLLVSVSRIWLYLCVPQGLGTETWLKGNAIVIKHEILTWSKLRAVTIYHHLHYHHHHHYLNKTCIQMVEIPVPPIISTHILLLWDSKPRFFRYSLLSAKPCMHAVFKITCSVNVRLKKYISIVDWDLDYRSAFSYFEDFVYSII